jgi:tetratricopeptide (TPR) repeat protein
LLSVISLLLLLAINAAELQTQGLQYLDKQDYQAAAAVFEQLVAQDPKDYTSLFNLALAETGLKKDESAIAHFKQALALKAGLHPAELNLALLYLRNHREAEAVPLLDSVVKSNPEEVRPHVYLGDALQATGKWEDAATQYQQALHLDPKNARAELGLGRSLLRAGKLDDAVAHYRQAASLDSSTKPYLLEIASSLIDAHRDADAIPLLEEFPENAGAREKLGQIYLQTGEPAQAAAEFEAAVKLSPTPANQLALATAYLRNRQEDKAAPILREALAHSPNDYDLQMAVGRIFRDQRNFAEAGNHFVAATKLKPEVDEPWSELAAVSVMAGMYPQALAALDKLHQLNAEKPGHFYLRAIVLDKLHQPKPALANYQRFLELSDGKNPDQEFQARHRAKLLEHEVNR